MAAALPSCAARSGTRTRRVLGSGRAPSILQIVAHQDDDVLFMNPDLSEALAAGIPTTTVYLTAGEAMGSLHHSRNRVQFAADKQDATRSAYAQMLGVSGAWDRQTVTLPGGQSAESSTPPGIDHVRLVYLNLPEAYDVAAVPDIAGVPRGMALTGLLLGQRTDVPTIVPDSGPITESYRHTKESLLAALTAFLHECRPTVVRTLDPMFAEQHWRGSADIGGDHPDHIATARWVDVALQQYLAEEPASRVFMTNYVGYGMTALAANLSSAQSTAKSATFKAYSTHDADARRYANSYPPYQHRRHHRWTPGSLRAVPAGTGVAVFGVVDQQAVQWTCADVTGVWSGPFALGGTGVRALEAVTQADGRIRLFALQVDAMAGVSGNLRTLTDGADHWLPWTRLGGRYVLDGVCPLVDADGVLQAYATAMVEPAAAAQPAVARLVRWAQPNGKGPLAPDTLFPAVQTAGTPVAVLDQEGTPRVLYQLPDMAGTGMLTPNANGTWGPATELAATGGSGPIAAVAAPAPAGRRLHVAVGTPGGGIGIFQQGTDASFPAAWQDLGGWWPGPPALAADPSGRVVAVAPGPDGRLAVACQPQPGTGVAYSGFRTVGN
ncbi:PIG-L family deacetylase [Catenulispora sp. MAP12-49]|uniref:PIG-L family deacetylase n=1 Tax=Catenulispora sp. MAP12-49 TaxID=3156302 RepID=UPI003518018B